jgi:8-oxo-dGTP pyrophosphatase MutT (NUDIX family)
MSPIFSETTQWKDKRYLVELFAAPSYEGPLPITQIQGVCFSSPDTVVFYTHKDGWHGNPGGTIDPGETPKESLRRELVEEAQLEMLSCRIIGFEKITPVSHDEPTKIFLRARCDVRLIDAPIADPCEKAVGRIEVPLAEAAKILNWGKKGEALLELAQRA